MSRIATLTAVLTMLVAPTAFADGPASLRTPDAQDAAAPVVTKVDLRSPDAATPVRITASGQDLRSPDAIDVFSPSTPVSHAAPADDGSLSTWAFLAIAIAALVACAGLAVMLRRHLDVGRPVGV